MKIKSIYFNIIHLFLFLFLEGITAIAQIDSANIAKTPINIEDTTAVTDSLKKASSSKDFLVKFKSKFNHQSLSTYSTNKKEIDKLNYRYSGDVLHYLPFAAVYDFGYLGAPNEPIIFNTGFGALNENNLFYNNRWNDANDLNILQSEEINKLSIVPLHKSFLFSGSNKLSAINILTIDSLKRKPISRIRYYQASNEEGFIDAYFSARVLSRLAISLRLTNSSVENNYFNSSYGAWKVNLKGIYKLSDSLFAKLSFHHSKLNTALNGGVDVANLISNPLATESSIYNNQAPVFYNNQINETTSNLLDGKVYGDFIPTGYTEILFSYQSYKSRLKRTSIDSVFINNKNEYYILSGKLMHDIIFSNFSSSITAGYEFIDYKVEGIDYFEKINNYYATAVFRYNFFDGLLSPSLFGKISEFNLQTNNGIGIDLLLKPNSNFSILMGYSKFNRPYSIVEKSFIPDATNSNVSSFFVSSEFNSRITSTSVSFFNIISTNNAVPVFNNQNIKLGSSRIIFKGSEDILLSGMNINSSIKIWNLQLNNNFNYYWQDENSFSKNPNFNFTSGIYYVDTLFNSNLDLKTGFTFYLFDNISYRAYDFQQMRSSSYYLENNIIKPFQFYDVENDNYRLDFLLAGRIQDRATFYFVYENILGNNYYVIPYYPMPEGGIKIGISWDFID